MFKKRTFFNRFSTAFVPAMLLLGACKSNVAPVTPGLSANAESASGDTVFALRITEVKPGQLAEFNATREAFIVQQEGHEGFENGVMFESFFVIPPAKLTSPVFIRLTEWDSMEAFKRANKVLNNSEAFKQYATTFNELANFQGKTEGGQAFDISDIVKDGQAIEFAVRTIKPDFVDVFPQRRKAFFEDTAAKHAGYVLDQEFLAVEGDQRGVIIAWDSKEDFQNGLQAVFQEPATREFLSIIVPQTYQAAQKVE